MSESEIQPLNNPERILALKHSGLLRHDLAGRLDLLCETGSHLLNAPLCQVNVIEGSTQTSVGIWPPGYNRTHDVEIDGAGCRYVVMAEDVVSIPNTLLHPVMCIQPIVTVAGVLSYLGVPIWYERQVVGTFCVADTKIREWTYWEISGLQGLARLAGLSVDRDQE